VKPCARLYWLHALTPVHVGAGRGTGFIDLPVMRERATGWPIIPGSTLKGVMRDHVDSCRSDLFDVAFGRGGLDAAAGSLVYSDGRLILLPVRSLYGTFGYCTSPLALARLLRDMEHAGFPQSLPDLGPGDAEAWLTTNSVLAHGKKAYLDDLDFEGQPRPETDAWAAFLGDELFGQTPWAAFFRSRFVVLSDDTFNYYAEFGTEVAAHIRIEEETRTVAQGALWYEESLPAETVLAGVVWCDRVYSKDVAPQTLLDAFCREALCLQIGGKASVGRGRVRFLFMGGGRP